jgi:hypothetical protein
MKVLISVMIQPVEDYYIPRQVSKPWECYLAEIPNETLW